jgi:CspA family cold shock protein
MALGTLIWWNADRGFGFICPDEGGPDLFLRVSALEEAGIHHGNLRTGQPLIYEMGDHHGKTKAVHVRLV